MSLKRLAFLVVGLLALGAVAYFVLATARPPSGGTFAVKTRPRAKPPSGLVDATNGALLFRDNCASCHGFRGRGDGPAHRYLWRQPRDLTDASYMLRRSDEELFTVLSGGGHAGNRSNLMPSWATIFHAYDRRDLIAHLRTLHPRFEDAWPEAAEFRYRESVLTEDDAGEIVTAIGRPLPEALHLVGFFEVLRGGSVIGYVTFGAISASSVKSVENSGRHSRMFPLRWKVPGLSLDTILCLGIDTQGTIRRLRTFDELVFMYAGGAEQSLDVKLNLWVGKGETTLKDPAAVPPGETFEVADGLREAALALVLRLKFAVERDQEEWKLVENPPDLRSEPERSYRKNCASCHGITGSGKRPPGVGMDDPAPTDLTDGFHMNRRTDQELRDVILKGGLHMNISPSMPSYEGVFSEQEVEELIRFVRSMAIPQSR